MPEHRQAGLSNIACNVRDAAPVPPRVSQEHTATSHARAELALNTMASALCVQCNADARRFVRTLRVVRQNTVTARPRHDKVWLWYVNNYGR